MSGRPVSEPRAWPAQSPRAVEDRVGRHHRDPCDRNRDNHALARADARMQQTSRDPSNHHRRQRDRHGPQERATPADCQLRERQPTLVGELCLRGGHRAPQQRARDEQHRQRTCRECAHHWS